MSPVALWENQRWQVVRPDRALTVGHLAIVDRSPQEPLDRRGAAELIAAYRRTRSALWQVAGSRGFMISFGVRREPEADGIGEPDPMAGARRAVHVFGRGPGDPRSPVRVMALPRAERQPVPLDESRIADLAAHLAGDENVDVPAPADHRCDGCAAEVTTDQELWRAEGVRVIRPRRRTIDAQVIVLPLRHVVSIGDLTAEEVAAIASRLAEAGREFASSSGSTGLSCFANDGLAARQETPHVHVHVFGRSPDEPANPFVLLARDLQGNQPAAG